VGYFVIGMISDWGLEPNKVSVNTTSEKYLAYLPFKCLRLHFCAVSSLAPFKRNLKTFLFRQTFNCNCPSSSSEVIRHTCAIQIQLQFIYLFTYLLLLLLLLLLIWGHGCVPLARPLPFTSLLFRGWVNGYLTSLRQLVWIKRNIFINFCCFFL